MVKILKHLLIICTIATFVGTKIYAQPRELRDTMASIVLDSMAVHVSDSLNVHYADTVEMSDSAYMAKQAEEAAKRQPVKVVNRGFDISKLVNARRQRSVDFTPFTNKPFMANTFTSVSVRTNKILTEDYSFGLMGRVSFGKWVHEDHAVRGSISYGNWQDNFDGSNIQSYELDASYLFNLSSYVGGYRTNRLCEVNIVSGIGYANSIHQGKLNHAFNAHVGANLNLRLFRGIDFFIEPAASIYTNGMAVSYAGNWRTWLAAFQTDMGLTYNIKQSKSPASPRLHAMKDGWYVSLLGGPHFQNSKLVYEHVGLKNALGVHMALGIGKYYTDYFAVRYSGAYTRGTWVQYGEDELPCNYFAARVEGMLDFISLFTKHEKGERPKFAASIAFGPEVGYMHKVDHQREDESKKLVIGEPYLGFTGGIQGKMRPTKRLALFVEPRFSIIPYKAPYYNESSINDYRNYHDGIVNFNFGIEFLL